MSAAAPVPEIYICPISFDIMDDPVIDPYGNSYEKKCILEWLVDHNFSPLNKQPLQAKDLIPNRSLKDAIELFKRNNPTFSLPDSMKTLSSCATLDDTLNVTVTKDSEFILLSLKADEVKDIPDALKQTPLDLCCVVDISGSMGSDASIKDGSGNSESHGMCVLDLVKHAMLTIVECLSENDRLSIVVFSDNANVVFSLTQMNAAGKTAARDKIETHLHPTNSTNIWDGLEKGMGTLDFDHSVALYRNSSVFLLTDGVPNITPPIGHIPMLKKYIEKKGVAANGFHNKYLPCSINTFGFGYSLDSNLLVEIAKFGNGSYAFIPDAGFVGTIFINALSNVLSSCANDINLSIKVSDDFEVDTKLISNLAPEVVGNTVKLHFGFASFGQTTDILLPIKPSKGRQWDSKSPYCEVSLSYSKPLTHQLVPNYTVYGTVVEDRSEYFAHYIRFKTVNAILSSVNGNDQSPAAGTPNTLKTLADEFEYVLAKLAASSGSNNVSSLEYVRDLKKDVDGQVTEALTVNEYYSKWGRHYLPSLAGAHLKQKCNNFKDPGVQHYGGLLFAKLRDLLNDSFCALPAPAPCNPPSHVFTSSYSGGGSAAPPPAPARNINMAMYNFSGGVCFHENCQIAVGSKLALKRAVMQAEDFDWAFVSDPQVALTENCPKVVRRVNGALEYSLLRDAFIYKQVKDIKRGDLVLTENGSFSKIKFVVQTICKNGFEPLIHFPNGLKITPYHPMKNPEFPASDTWYFPISLNKEVINTQCKSVYSFVLDDADANVCINGTWCVGMGHDCKGEIIDESLQDSASCIGKSILQHPYFGNRKGVLADLQGLDYRKNGLIKINNSYIVRDAISHTITGIKDPACY